MKTTTELEIAQPQAVARQAPSVADMLQTIVERGITVESVAAVEQLVKLYERMEEKKAEKEFTAAFVALQSELPTIVAKTVIPNRGKYQKFEDVMEEIGPLLQTHGFSVSFSMDVKDNRVLETCHLKHIGGHSQSNSFAVRVGKADTETQADCKAATTAKRNALLNALNIVIRQDVLQSEEGDAALEGDPNAKISQTQADGIEHRAKMTNSDIPSLLKYAGGVKTFADIPANRFDEIDRILRQKEQSKRGT